MDIQKCKVEKNREWSATVVKGLAVALGVSALVSLEGCASNAAKTGDDLAKQISPSPSLSGQSSSSMSNSSNANPSISSSSVDVFDSGIEMSEEDKENFKKFLEKQSKNDSYEEPVGGLMELD